MSPKNAQIDFEKYQIHRNNLKTSRQLQPQPNLTMIGEVYFPEPGRETKTAQGTVDS